jgi:hypothetical protein
MTEMNLVLRFLGCLLLKNSWRAWRPFDAAQDMLGGR